MLVRTRPFNPALDRRFDRAFDQLDQLVAGHRPPRTPVVDAAWHDGRSCSPSTCPAPRPTPSASPSPAAR